MRDSSCSSSNLCARLRWIARSFVGMRVLGFRHMDGDLHQGVSAQNVPSPTTGLADLGGARTRRRCAEGAVYVAGRAIHGRESASEKSGGVTVRLFFKGHIV